MRLGALLICLLLPWQASAGSSQFFEWQHRRMDGQFFDADLKTRAEVDRFGPVIPFAGQNNPCGGICHVKEFTRG